ncbi:MAG: hypothetical protein IKJ29_09790 [Akkermansia sp.]|nr:hypothetical protein [Akkermansia sp.]
MPDSFAFVKQILRGVHTIHAAARMEQPARLIVVNSWFLTQKDIASTHSPHILIVFPGIRSFLAVRAEQKK